MQLMDFPVHRKWRGQGTSTKLCALWIPVRNDAAKVWGMRRIVVQDNQKRIRAVKKAPLLAAVMNGELDRSILVERCVKLGLMV
jgi:hypothetical protein